MVSRRRVVILGSTGSIGTQALDIIRRNPDRFEVVGLAAGGSRPALLAEQAAEFDVPVVAMAGEADPPVTLGGRTVLQGPDAPTRVAGLPCDVVLNGMTGSAGLLPTLEALRVGSVLALANKESLIIGGPIVQALASPGQIVPVDSEHSALAQCLRGGREQEVRRLVLTASGGPFRERRRSELRDVTPQEALRHPTWAMGPLVTVNSATLVNKGLELIEAHLLFGVPLDRIDVVVHPQSVVHSMVEFVDGSTLLQASPPDMRLPIALGLAWPNRVPEAAPGCDWSAATAWEFHPLDDEAFPAVGIARAAAAAGGTAPAVFNGADEACVEAFLEGHCGFLDIVDTIAAVLDEHLAQRQAGDGAERNPMTVGDVLSADDWARRRAREIIEVG